MAEDWNPLGVPWEARTGSDDDRRARRDGGEHAVVRACREVVDVDADHGVGAHLLGAPAHLADRGARRLLQLVLVGARAAPEEVGQARADVLDHVHTLYRLARDHAEVLLDRVALQGGGGDDQHARSFLRFMCGRSKTSDRRRVGGAKQGGIMHTAVPALRLRFGASRVNRALADVAQTVAMRFPEPLVTHGAELDDQQLAVQAQE